MVIAVIGYSIVPLRGRMEYPFRVQTQTLITSTCKKYHIEDISKYIYTTNAKILQYLPTKLNFRLSSSSHSGFTFFFKEATVVGLRRDPSCLDILNYLNHLLLVSVFFFWNAFSFSILPHDSVLYLLVESLFSAFFFVFSLSFARHFLLFFFSSFLLTLFSSICFSGPHLLSLLRFLLFLYNSWTFFVLDLIIFFCFGPACVCT